jgi:hypothetical protein
MFSGEDDGDSGELEDGSARTRSSAWLGSSPEMRVPPLRSVPSPGVGRNWGRFWARDTCVDGDALSLSSEGSDGGG